MAIVTELSSGDNKVIEKLLELYLKKHEEATTEAEREQCEVIMKLVYDSESEQARDCCKKLEKSMGFAYIIDKYKHFERSLSFFAHEFTKEIIDQHTEKTIHEEYDSFDSFESDKPKSFLIKDISNYDEDLSSFIKTNISEIDFIEECIDKIKNNWPSYESQTDISRLFLDLEICFDNNSKRSSFTKTDILIYLSVKNNMIEDFKSYYKMEDTADEELEELIENNNVEEKLSSPEDMLLISKMDAIIKENKNKKIKRLNN